MSDLLTNQFKQSNRVGVLDLSTNPNPSVMYVRLDPDITTNAVPGEGLALTDLGASDFSGPPVVTKRTADTSVIEGVMVYDVKSASKEASSIVSIAKKGAVITMEASEAITRGATVALVLASPGQVAIRTTETILGKSLDKATASGDLIRVEILSEGV